MKTLTNIFDRQPAGAGATTYNKGQFNADLIYVVASRQGIVAHCAMKHQDIKNVKLGAIKAPGFSNEVCSLNVIAQVLQHLDDDVKDITFVSDRNVIMRYLQIKSLIRKHPRMGAEKISSLIAKDWMDRDLIDTIDIAVNAMFMVKDKVYLNFVPRRTLTDFMLESAMCEINGVQDGDVLEFQNGVANGNINCIDTTYLNGKFAVKKEVLRYHDKDVVNYYVERTGKSRQLQIVRKMNDAVQSKLPNKAIIRNDDIVIIDEDIVA